MARFESYTSKIFKFINQLHVKNLCIILVPMVLNSKGMVSNTSAKYNVTSNTHQQINLAPIVISLSRFSVN